MSSKQPVGEQEIKLSSLRPELVSELFGVSEKELRATGAFNAVLTRDSRFYVDPALLKVASTPELAQSYKSLEKRFSEVMNLLAKADLGSGVLWQGALNHFYFPEAQGTCIGYSFTGVQGRSMGLKQRRDILTNVKELLDKGVDEPELFELSPIFTVGVGADLLSDMVVGAILADLCAYTLRVAKGFGVPLQLFHIDAKEWLLPCNPHSSLVSPHPVILIPEEILQPLPIAQDYADIDRVCLHNAELRRKLSRIIGESGAKRRTDEKAKVLQEFKDNPKLVDEVVQSYRADTPDSYDFNEDPLLEQKWLQIARDAVSRSPIDYKFPETPTAENIAELVIMISERLRDHIENGRYIHLLYRPHNIHEKEQVFQNLFLGIATEYCRIFDIDVSPETNAGRGPVDFKFSHGYHRKVVAELKLSSNTQVFHGYTVQVTEYANAERAKDSVFVVLKVEESDKRKHNLSMKRMARLERYVGSLDSTAQNRPTLIVIDGIPKLSASKYHP